MRAFALLPLLLAGCVSQGPFPSLAQREGERLSIEEPMREAPQVADDRQVAAFVAARLAEASGTAREFDRTYAEAARASGRAGREGSDSWLDAQQAISRAEAARLSTADALASLNAFALERAQRPLSEGDRRSLEAAIAEVERLAGEQQARIDRLRR